jgi:hypothetical protein
MFIAAMTKMSLKCLRLMKEAALPGPAIPLAPLSLDRLRSHGHLTAILLSNLSQQAAVNKQRSLPYQAIVLMSSSSMIVFLICLGLSAHAQDFKSLTYSAKLPVPTNFVKNGFAVQLPMKCAQDGTIFVRFAQAGSEPAVTLIQAEGKVASNIRLSAIPEFSQNDFYDFAPGNGYVFVLSGQGKPHVPSSYYISRFKTDGTYVASVKIDTGFRPDFEPVHIAAFSSGDLLLSGMVKGHDSPTVPFVGIFTSSGEFRREVVLKDDVTDKDAKERAPNADFTAEEQVRNLLEVSYLQTADDGNAYLMRHTPSGPVFVISPGGSARRVRLSPPAQDASLQWIMASGGLIATQYRSAASDGAAHKTHYLLVVDELTNKTRETVRYSQDYETNGGGLACYQNGSFTFLAGAPGGGLQLVRAGPQ